MLLSAKKAYVTCISDFNMGFLTVDWGLYNLMHCIYMYVHVCTCV